MPIVFMLLAMLAVELSLSSGPFIGMWHLKFFEYLAILITYCNGMI
jgi:hypothetical protein